MSTAANHRKRSHRSQRMHYNACDKRLIKNLDRQIGEAYMKENLLGRLIRRIRNVVAEGK